MFTVLDVETTISLKKNGEKDGSPFNKNNKLVSVGFCNVYSKAPVEYFFFNHMDCPKNPEYYKLLQSVLDNTKTLIGHNIKYDLEWLLECGFKYSGKTYCTMIGEYILARGIKVGLSLEDICKRRHIEEKKINLIQPYLDKNIGMDQIPFEIVKEYGIQDVVSTSQLFLVQLKEYLKKENIGLGPTLDMMNEFTQTLCDIERNGVNINLEKLNIIKENYKKEQQQLALSLKKTVEKYMGCTNINLQSPEQLSTLLYSRCLLDKQKWSEVFNIGMEWTGLSFKPKRRPKYSNFEFIQLVRALTRPIMKTTVEQCSGCCGRGYIFKTKKDLSLYKKSSICKMCNREGYIYTDTTEIAGFKLKPKTPEDVANGGFKTDKQTLQYLLFETKNIEIKSFLHDYIYYNAISTYLDTFIKLIENDVYENGILHIGFGQCITSTGRLSSRFHNMPRNKTFPINDIFISRFDNGLMLKADYKGLEYRTAVCLAKDEAGLSDILNKVDPHLFTSSHVGLSRQDSKEHTFAPLYGATPHGKPEKIANYYIAFMNKHKGIGIYQQELQDEAIRNRKVKLPSGREYSFANARRTRNGGSTYATSIKNWPIQGFATADIVPCAGIRLRRAMMEKNVKSLMVNTTHDDYKFDIYPDEVEIMVRLVRDNMEAVKEELINRYGFDFYIPLEVELAIGPSLLDLKEV